MGKEVVATNVPSGAVKVKECGAEELNLGVDEVGADGKVDVIVSEWMGYFLLFENMLPSVLSIRDRYLRPGGSMLPSRCRLLVALMEDTTWRDSKFEFWKSVHGIDMSALVPLAKATRCEQGEHRFVDPAALLSEPVEVLAIDLH